MILKLLWPEICPFCGKVCREGICPACKILLKKRSISQPYCMSCGKPLRRVEQEYCHDCENLEHFFDCGRAIWVHKPPVNHSIYQFKYHNQRMFGQYYADEMLKKFELVIKQWNPDLIIPIPLHFKRKRKRGYNQSMIIAKELGKRLHIPVSDRVLKRIRSTNPQKKLDHATRKKNLYNAFAVSKILPGVKRILLIDDIYTTGNTINEAARILKEAGIENVFFLTVSIGQGY